MSEYSLIANTYDFLLAPFLTGLRKKILEVTDSLNPEKIVDLCCGTGNQLKLLKKRGYADLTCVDLSKDMLSVASKGNHAPVCCHADAAETGFDSDSFDLAMISLALHEKPAETGRAIIKEAYRILKPGGHLLISDYVSGKSVPAPVSAVIRFIEFLVGGDHFKNYKNYISAGGIDNLMDISKFKTAGSQKAAAGGIFIKIYDVLK